MAKQGTARIEKSTQRGLKSRKPSKIPESHPQTSSKEEVKGKGRHNRRGLKCPRGPEKDSNQGNEPEIPESFQPDFLKVKGEEQQNRG